MSESIETGMTAHMMQMTRIQHGILHLKKNILAQLVNRLNLMIPVSDIIPPHLEPTKESEKIP